MIYVSVIRNRQKQAENKIRVHWNVGSVSKKRAFYMEVPQKRIKLSKKKKNYLMDVKNQ